MEEEKKISKKLQAVNVNTETFKNYFKEDLDAIEEELKKSKEYSEIIDNEINKLTVPALGSNKGAQHYLIEHITNAVQLQTQRQGLRKDRFAIKKAIMDYAAKFADSAESSDSDAVTKLLSELLEQDKTNKTQTNTVVEESSESLDNEIDEILNEDGD